MRKAIIRRRKREKGQAFVEYVILIAVVALAALFVLANFSDRLRDMVAGITATLGGTSEKPVDSLQQVKDLKDTGIE
ncbi:MAG: hypothetical protein E7054_06875 [Lentisphaerae bacterium]|nr:hypothetical protein [Lentisphaerota bacterium]